MQLTITNIHCYTCTMASWSCTEYVVEVQCVAQQGSHKPHNKVASLLCYMLHIDLVLHLVTFADHDLPMASKQEGTRTASECVYWIHNYDWLCHLAIQNGITTLISRMVLCIMIELYAILWIWWFLGSYTCNCSLLCSHMTPLLYSIYM